jgi:hypothetical protein
MTDPEYGQAPPPPPPEYGGYEPPPPPAAPPLPWEDRQRLGFAAALVETVKLFVMSPGEAFRRARQSGDYGSPILYALVIGWVMAIVGALWSTLFQTTVMSMLPLPPEIRGQMGGAMAGGVMGFVMTLVLAPIFIMIGLFLWSGIVHLCLMLVGGAKDSKAGFEGTLRAVGYAQTGGLAQIVPIFGGLVAGVWQIVLAILGVAAMHRTSTGKAAAAVLIPIALCCVCAIAAVVIFGAALMAAISGAAAGN